MRKSGILLPVFSLPDPYGPGCFSEAAYEFIDQLSAAGQSYWQILPITTLGKGDSPYSPLSCFAGEPGLIDPHALKREGLLDDEEIGPDRPGMLRKAYENFLARNRSEGALDRFCRENADWLEDYALYAALREKNGNTPWIEWPEPLRTRRKEALTEARRELSGDIRFHQWIQYEFDREWQALRSYAHEKGIEIIGDIPIYASYESADCWSSPHLFRLNGELRPEVISGCPPDSFNSEGQIWENPIYDWEAIRADGYRWWIARLRRMFRLYDVVRLDHARGFESFFQIPVRTMRAADGWWTKGPGLDFFNAVRDALGSCRFIAEDLGFMTPEVAAMIRDAGLPNMKVAQFAFEGGPDDDHRPENVGPHSVLYTGTHDNDTTVGWYLDPPDPVIRQNADGYFRWHLGRPDYTAEEVCDLLIRLCMESRAMIVIIPVQDYLHLGSEARINVPGTTSGNWKWQMAKGSITDEVIRRIRDFSEKAGRNL